MFTLQYGFIKCTATQETKQQQQQQPTQHIDDFDPQITSIETKHIIEKKDYKKIVFEVYGRNIQKGINIHVTDLPANRNAICKKDLNFNNNINYNVSEVWTHEFIMAQYELFIPNKFNGILYLCLPHHKTIQNIRDNSGWIPPNLIKSDLWYHQGPNITINTTTNK